MRGVENAYAQRKQKLIETFLTKEISEENVENFFDIEKNDLFSNAVTQ